MFKNRGSLLFCLNLALAASSLTDVHGKPLTTTLYISQHFEVRDHEQPTKYVFNGSVRIAKVIGSLSSNFRVQRLRLYAGWNLCSIAVSGSFQTDVADVIANVYQWDAVSGSYLPVDMAAALKAGTILWVQSKTNATVIVMGSYDDPPPQQLQTGGTYLPGAGLEAWSPSLPLSASIWIFEADKAQWSDHLPAELATLPGPLLTLAPGHAWYSRSESAVLLQLPDPALRIHYYHQDHLGSSSAVSDSRGGLVEELAFYPFGCSRNEVELRQLHEPYQFTQKERDRESGLDYFAARYLAVSLARFITPDGKYKNPDSLGAEDLSGLLRTPGEWNLYAYVKNNPLRFVDPTGLGPLDSMIYYDERKAAAAAAAAKPAPPPTRQKATFYDQPKRAVASPTTWRASLSAVCQKEPGKSNYKVLDTIFYGFDIDAAGNVNPVNPVGGTRINVSSFNVYNGLKGGTPMGGVTINADFTGSCEYSVQWVQTIMTSSPHRGCSNIYNDPCISDDPPGGDLPFYYTNKEIPKHVQELDNSPRSIANDTMRKWNAIFQ